MVEIAKCASNILVSTHLSSPLFNTLNRDLDKAIRAGRNNLVLGTLRNSNVEVLGESVVVEVQVVALVLQVACPLFPLALVLCLVVLSEFDRISCDERSESREVWS